MARMIVRYTKKGTRVTVRTKVGNGFVTRSTGAGRKPKVTYSTRSGNTTYVRSY